MPCWLTGCAESLAEEQLAVSRLEAHVERNILATLLQREPRDTDFELLERGVGVVPSAEKFARLIAATYSGFFQIDATLDRDVRMLNSAARAIIGKGLFESNR